MKVKQRLEEQMPKKQLIEEKKEDPKMKEIESEN